MSNSLGLINQCELLKKRPRRIISVLSNSLPRFIVVPQKVLDTELKKSFAHFNEGRIPVSTPGRAGHPRLSVSPSRRRRFSVLDVLFQALLRCVAALVLETPPGQRSAADGQFPEQHLSRERRHQVGVRVRGFPVWLFLHVSSKDERSLCCGFHRTKASVALRHFWGLR